MKAEKVLVELPTLGNSVNAVQLAMGVAEKHNAQKNRSGRSGFVERITTKTT